MENLLTKAELKKALNISETAYSNMLKRGCPSYHFTPNILLFDLEEVKNWAKNKTTAPNDAEVEEFKEKGYLTTFSGRHYLTEKGLRKLKEA
jgi:hypothetical protein